MASRRGRGIARRGVSAMTLGLLAAFALVPGAGAQALGELSCKALWYQRNAVYAEQGYCFKTKDAIATFGARCYPPFGKLSPDQQRFVNEVQSWEARKGCR